MAGLESQLLHPPTARALSSYIVTEGLPFITTKSLFANPGLLLTQQRLRPYSKAVFEASEEEHDTNGITWHYIQRMHLNKYTNPGLI